MMTQVSPEADNGDRLLPVFSGRRRKMLVIFICSVVGAALVLPFPMTGRGWSALFDLAHAPVFFLMFLIIVLLVDPAAAGFGRGTRPLMRLTNPRLLLLSEVLIVVGVACELAQKFVGRHASFGDIVANCAGLAAGTLFCFANQRRSLYQRGALILGVALLVLLPCLEPIRELNECVWQRLDFPVLASFERTQELRAWAPHNAKVSLNREWSSAGASSMRVEALSPEYPGNLMVWPVSDWRKFSVLRFEIYNPSDSEIHVGINIGDALHYKSGFSPDDRFGRAYQVPPHETVSVEIDLQEVAAAPLSRKMVMSHVTHLDIYLVESAPGLVFQIDHIRISP